VEEPYLMRTFSVVITWQNGFVQAWDYPHQEGDDWIARSLTASEFLSQFQADINSKTTETVPTLRSFLLKYFFTTEEETENGGWGILTSVTETTI